MAALNDLLAVYTPTRDVTANKAQLIEDLGGDQDTVYANLLAATGLTRATASFNDALHAYLEAHQPLGMFDWKAVFYGGDPLWTPPADGGAVAAFRNGGTTRTEGAYLSTAGLVTPATAGNRSSVPDAANLDITGDITLVAHVAPDDWTPAATSALISKASLSSTAYVLAVLTGGTIQLYTTADGSTAVTGTSTAATGFTDGTAHWVAATLDVDNGAGGRDYTFWTSEDGVTWTQLGSTVTEGATTSIATNTADVQSPGAINQAVFPFAGTVKGYQVWSGSSFTTAGPGGTKILDVDFTGRADVSAFTASTGQTVTVLNSLDASQATGSKQPAYRASVAALNNKPAVQGDGSDDFLQTGNWSSALTQTWSTVLVGSIAAVGDVLMDGNDGTNRGLLWRRTTVDQFNINNGLSVDTSVAGDADQHLFVVIGAGATTDVEMDGTEVVSDGNGGTASLDGFTLLANNAGAGATCNAGYIAFAGAIAGDIRDHANWAAFKAWVADHYGLTIA